MVSFCTVLRAPRISFSVAKIAIEQGANVVLTKTMPIIDVTGPEPKELRGEIPERAVVIPGTRPKKFPAGEYGTPCALIIGMRKESTDQKTSLNAALRDFGVSA